MNYQDLAKHFGVANIGQIRFAHAVNSQIRLEKYVKDPTIHILEGDISLHESVKMVMKGDLTISPSGEIIMTEPPVSESDLIFTEWLKVAIEGGKGVKLDFKMPEAVGPCLRKLTNCNLKNSIVILNADILVGPGGALSPFDSYEFLRLYQQTSGITMLSLGWKTRLQEGNEYSSLSVEKMLSLTQNLDNLVTFPIRAFYLRDSWNNLQKLLAKPNFSLTLWNNEPIDPELLAWIKQNTNPEKTFCDLINYPGGSPLLI